MFPKIYRIFFLALLFLNLITATALCSVSAEFSQKIETLKWVAYSPTNYYPDEGVLPTEDSIRKDLSLLYDYGFRGIVTYGAYGSLGRIPRIAAETGFRGIIMGIWDINNQEELSNALAAKGYVDGYCVGNEGLNKRYDLESLNRAIEEIKSSTNKPATTTEEINDYYNTTLDLISVGDWVFPNIHPFLNEVTEPEKAVAWVEKHYSLLKKHAPEGKIILFKETGFPTGGADGASETNQEDFFIRLRSSGILFVYFEAFDQEWKGGVLVEPHWGLFDYNRQPKKFISSQKNS